MGNAARGDPASGHRAGAVKRLATLAQRAHMREASTFDAKKGTLLKASAGFWIGPHPFTSRNPMD